MVAKKTTGQICKKCRGKNPKKAKFCMDCGKKLNPKSTKLWPGKILRIKKGLDPKIMVASILASVNNPEYIDFDPKKLTEEDLRVGLAQLSQKSQQLLIRLTGADGKQPRSIREVAEEAGYHCYSVKERASSAFVHLALELRLIRPSREFRKRSDDSFKRVQDFLDGVHSKK